VQEYVNLFSVNKQKVARMNASVHPLVIHNCTNDDIICRYMQQGKMGRAEVRIGPRGQKMIQDAYQGMKIFASSMFDPSSSFASLQVNQNVDEIYFDGQSGGYGRGSPVGPPDTPAHQESFERSRTRTRKINGAASLITT
jgi:hypothetical protein